jgi:hypothetical protein
LVLDAKPDPSVWDVADALRDAYKRQTVRIAEDRFLPSLRLGHSKKGPHIFRVDTGGEVRYVTGPCEAIGSGTQIARSQLMSARKLDHDTAEWDATYFVAEAKFMAEASRPVGKKTVIFVMRGENGAIHQSVLLTNQDTAKIREIWRHEARPPVPQSLSKRMSEIITGKIRPVGKSGLKLTIPSPSNQPPLQE